MIETFVFIFISILIFQFFIKCYMLYRPKFKNELDGPSFPIPFFGNNLQIGKNKILYFHKLENYFKKGIFRVWIGEVFTVIISDPLIEKEMKKTFKEKPKYIKRDIFILNLKSNLINLVFNESTINLTQSMNCSIKNNKEFEPKLLCSIFSFSIIFKLLFNIDLKNENYKEIKKIMKLVNEINKNKEKSNTSDLNSITNFIENQFYYHVSNIDQSLKDFMDIIIYKENSFETKEKIKKQVVYKCTDYILNKSESISKVIENFFVLIAQDQDYQYLAFNELKSVINTKLLYNGVGENIIKLSDKSYTPITNSICKEVLRLNPVDQLSSPITCKKDSLINGYFIPKDSQIIINHKSMNLNEKYFNDPFNFNPKRFLNYNNQSINFYSCSFSSDEIYIAISNILLNFKITAVKNHYNFNVFDDNLQSSVLIEKR
ncbi:hypothetical protein ACTFIR_008930 [Dictyostelium discoideum]